MIYKILFIFCLPLLILNSCKKEEFTEGEAIGLWKQVSVTEDGTEMTLTPEQEACKILIDANGICRYYNRSFEHFDNGNGPTSFYGTWSMLDNKWINFTVDKWKMGAALTSDSALVMLSYVTDTNIIDTAKTVKGQWKKYHVQTRFSILQLNNDLMQIRLKTFEGEKKYALLFAPASDDFIELNSSTSTIVSYSPKMVTDDNYWIIRDEFRTLKTYIFTFERENY